MKKMNVKKVIAIAAAAVMGLATFTGCVSSNDSISSGTPAAAALDNQAVGAILLSVNPEIEIEYDGQGMVLEVEGKNDDGKKIVERYSGYSGKDCKTVVSELVEEIYQDGYFQEEIDGHEKNIVVKLEEGSRYPDDDFLEEVAEGVRHTVELHKLSSSTMTVEEKDYTSSGYIGLEKAKELVLAQLGLKEAQFVDKEYELDDGVYELEFTANGTEYEFEVDAVTGKVMEADYDHNDDWNTNTGKDHNQGQNSTVAKPTPKPTVKPTIRPNNQYDDDRYEEEDNDRYDDDRYEEEDNDRYDDDRYEEEDDDRYDDDRYEEEDDDRYDDDRYEEEDDDRYDDDRYED